MINLLVLQSFFQELEKHATILFSASRPTAGLRVAAPPSMPIPATATTTSQPVIGTPPQSQEVGAFSLNKFDKFDQMKAKKTTSWGTYTGSAQNIAKKISRTQPTPPVVAPVATPLPPHTLTLNQVGDEVQRRYGSRAPIMANSMATQANAGAAALQSAGTAPSTVPVRFSGRDAFDHSVDGAAEYYPHGGQTPNGSIHYSGMSPAAVGHEAGHAVDFAAHGNNPDFFGRRGFMGGGSGAIPSEVSATRQALQAGNLSHADIAYVLSGTSSYLEKEVPELQKSLKGLRKHLNPAPEAVTADALRRKKIEDLRSKYRRAGSFDPSQRPLGPETLQQATISRVRTDLEGPRALNPFVDPVSTKARKATEKHVHIVADELEKHFGAEHANTYRQHMLGQLANPSRARLNYTPTVTAPSAALGKLKNVGKKALKVLK